MIVLPVAKLTSKKHIRQKIIFYAERKLNHVPQFFKYTFFTKWLVSWSNVTYRDDEGDVDLAGLALLLFAVDDVHVGDGEVVQAVLVMVPHHTAVVHRAVPAVQTSNLEKEAIETCPCNTEVMWRLPL